MPVPTLCWRFLYPGCSRINSCSLANAWRILTPASISCNKTHAPTRLQLPLDLSLRHSEELACAAEYTHLLASVDDTNEATLERDDSVEKCILCVRSCSAACRRGQERTVCQSMTADLLLHKYQRCTWVHKVQFREHTYSAIASRIHLCQHNATCKE